MEAILAAFFPPWQTQILASEWLRTYWQASGELVVYTPAGTHPEIQVPWIVKNNSAELNPIIPVTSRGCIPILTQDLANLHSQRCNHSIPQSILVILPISVLDIVLINNSRSISPSIAVLDELLHISNHILHIQLPELSVPG